MKNVPWIEYTLNQSKSSQSNQFYILIETLFVYTFFLQLFYKLSFTSKQ